MCLPHMVFKLCRLSPRYCTTQQKILTKQLTPWSRVILEKFPHNLWNLNVHYGFHNILPRVLILIQMNLIHTFQSVFLFQAQLHCIPSSMPRSPKRYLPSYLTTKMLYAFIFFPMRATCPVHLTFFDLITLIMFGEEQKPQSLSLCSFLQSPVKLANFEALLSPSCILSQLLPQCAFTPARKNSQILFSRFSSTF